MKSEKRKVKNPFAHILIVDKGKWIFHFSFFTLHLISFFSVFLRRLACGVLEELAEEAYVGEVEGVSYFGHLPTAVS